MVTNANSTSVAERAAHTNLSPRTINRPIITGTYKPSASTEIATTPLSIRARVARPIFPARTVCTPIIFCHQSVAIKPPDHGKLRIKIPTTSTEASCNTEKTACQRTRDTRSAAIHAMLANNTRITNAGTNAAIEAPNNTVIAHRCVLRAPAGR